MIISLIQSFIQSNNGFISYTILCQIYNKQLYLEPLQQLAQFQSVEKCGFM